MAGSPRSTAPIPDLEWVRRGLTHLNSYGTTATQMCYRAALSTAAKGGNLASITIGDVVELLTPRKRTPARRGGHAAFYRILHELGIFGEGAPATLRVLRTSGQRTPDELIDRYRLACRPVVGLHQPGLPRVLPGPDPDLRQRVGDRPPRPSTPRRAH